ncbi:alkaline phosphatase [Neobacillus terrae]|uniref:alkaline phosphatase n=1 Tax=Neobacillus terrae TaxID=3034837 RepID=UPI00140C36BD|nr:alkaline phosphatase [Neobacillus terrae]NHM29348.1 alkaline phosphatase [Neobacillus terrae]
MRKIVKRFFISLLITGITVLAGSPANTAKAAPRNPQLQKPKNIIYMIGDGMGIGQLEIGRLFEYGKEGTLFMQTLPHAGLARTYSANNFVTDSAAGATALATGRKTNNGMIGVTPDGKEVPSILDLFKKDGKKTGVISTSLVTDATPAGFTASVTNRWSGQPEIARQQLKNQVDVILGGGGDFFEPKNQNGLDLVNQYRKNGYSYVTDRNQLASVKGGKVLGLFNSSYMTYMQDREEAGSKEPTLNEMAQKGIETLSAGNKGFFVMIEGARIDHAAHSSDIPGIWRELIEFDEAVKYAVNWAEKRGDTLVVVTADHETMGVSAAEPINIEAYKRIKVSPEFMASKLIFDPNTGEFTAESVKSAFYHYAGLMITDKEVSDFNLRIKANKGQMYASKHAAWEIGSIIAQHMNAGINSSRIRALSSTGGHTANMVPIFAFGPGSERFDGVFNNIEIPKRMGQLLGYQF